MDSKKIIEKLVKIASSQQEIINRLAQSMIDNGIPLSGGADPVVQLVGQVVYQAANEVGAKSKFSVQSAMIDPASGRLNVKIQYPAALLGSPESKSVMDKAKQLLIGKTVGETTVKSVDMVGTTL